MSSSLADTVLIRDSRQPERYLLRTRRPWNRLVVAMRASSLDRRLAAGEPPESSILLAVRAQDLTSAASRNTLRRDWEHLLALPTKPRTRRTIYAHIRRARIETAIPEIKHLIATLAEPGVCTAQGIAMAKVLLTDGAGPLYGVRSALSLRAAIRKATTRLQYSPIIPG
jgi:hypothetical protein